MKSILDTRPVFHQLDETIKGHKRLESMGLDLECNDVKRNLLALQEVVLDETKNRKVSIRTASQGSCTSICRAVGIALRQTIREIA